MEVVLVVIQRNGPGVGARTRFSEYLFKQYEI